MMTESRRFAGHLQVLDHILDLFGGIVADQAVDLGEHFALDGVLTEEYPGERDDQQ
jgi:hypothetical protein